MGLFTIGIEKQLQAASAGIYSYPQIGQLKKDTVVIDEFLRETLNPTGALATYTTASNDSNGTISILDQKGLQLIPDTSAIGDDATARTSELSINRVTPNEIDNRTLITVFVNFSVRTITSIEGFIGILDSSSALTALPTTARHLGVFWDISAGANFTLSSGNATAQATTDSGVTVAANDRFTLRIQWTGDDTADISLFTGTFPTFTTQSTNHAATTILDGAVDRAMELHFFQQVEAAVSRPLDIHSWRADAI